MHSSVSSHSADLLELNFALFQTSLTCVFFFQCVPLLLGQIEVLHTALYLFILTTGIKLLTGDVAAVRKLCESLENR